MLTIISNSACAPFPRGAVSAPGDVGAHLHPGVDAKPRHWNVEQVPRYDLTNKLESKNDILTDHPWK